MQRQVCLLRGINLGSRNRVDMAELRGFFEQFGHRQVTTYVNSGNVVLTPAGELDAQQLRDKFARRFGFDAVVIVRSAADLGAIVRANPFPRADPATLHVGFTAGVAGRNVVEDLDLERFGPEQAIVRGSEFFLHLPAGMGRSRLPAYLDRRLGTPATVRNWNTVLALARLSSG